MARNDVWQYFVVAFSNAAWQHRPTMKLREEIQQWLEANPDERPSYLADRAGVGRSTLSRLLSGKRQGVHYTTADKLREIMRAAA